MTTETSSQTPQPQVIEHTDGSVTVKPAKGKHRNQAVTVLLESDDVLREKVGGFTNFLREYAVVGLAVGFIVGQQANAVVKQLVATFVDPMVKMWFGQNLSSRAATIHHNHEPIPIPWGAFVYTLIDFFLVLLTIYIVIKLFKLDKLRKIEDKK